MPKEKRTGIISLFYKKKY